jgi:hypothetical protein
MKISSFGFGHLLWHSQSWSLPLLPKFLLWWLVLSVSGICLDTLYNDFTSPSKVSTMMIGSFCFGHFSRHFPHSTTSPETSSTLVAHRNASFVSTQPKYLIPLKTKGKMQRPPPSSVSHSRSPFNSSPCDLTFPKTKPNGRN